MYTHLYYMYIHTCMCTRTCMIIVCTVHVHLYMNVCTRYECTVHRYILTCHAVLVCMIRRIRMDHRVTCAFYFFTGTIYTVPVLHVCTTTCSTGSSTSTGIMCLLVQYRYRCTCIFLPEFLHLMMNQSILFS